MRILVTDGIKLNLASYLPTYLASLSAFNDVNSRQDMSREYRLFEDKSCETHCVSRGEIRLGRWRASLDTDRSGEGVYLLRRNDRVVYVGQSRNIRSRLRSQADRGRLPISVLRTPSDIRREIESLLIRVIRPPLNNDMRLFGWDWYSLCPFLSVPMRGTGQLNARDRIAAALDIPRCILTQPWEDGGCDFYRLPRTSQIKAPWHTKWSDPLAPSAAEAK